MLADGIGKVFVDSLPCCRRAVLGIVRSEHDAEDILQEVYLAAAKQRLTNPGFVPQSGWYVTTAKNRAFSFVRKESVRRRNVEPLAPIPVDDEPINSLFAYEQESHVQLAVSKLPSVYGDLFNRMYFGNEASFAAIAAKDGLSEETVRTRFKRGKQILKTELAKFCND